MGSLCGFGTSFDQNGAYALRQRTVELGVGVADGCDRLCTGLDYDRLVFEHLQLGTVSNYEGSDQGSQFTSLAFTDELKRAGVVISMDGRGSAFHNVFVGCLWRSVKYEYIYLRGYATMGELVIGLTAYFAFYNEERPHQSLANQTPTAVYQTASGGGAMILEKYGDSLSETSDPLRSTDVYGSIVKDVKATATTEAKTVQRRAAANELEPTA